MVGVRKRRWLACGIAVCLVITVAIFLTFHPVSHSAADLKTGATNISDLMLGSLIKGVALNLMRP